MRRLIATATAMSSLLLLCIATSASAEPLSPWWHVTSGSRPASIQPGTARDEVQQVTVSAVSGAYELVVNFEGERRAEFTVGEKPQEFQVGLEGMFGVGSVSVTARSGPSNTDEIYEITFGNALRRRFIGTLRPAEELLVGGAESVTAKQVSEGRFDGEIVSTLTNMGDASVSGSKGPVHIVDTLPPGLRAESVTAITPVQNEAGAVPCSIESQSHVSCTFAGLPSETVTETAGLPPFFSIEVRIEVEVLGSASPYEDNTVSVTGGEAPSATISRPVRVGDEQPRFGVEDYGLIPEAPGGALDTQAGSHPFQTSFTVAMNQGVDDGPIIHGKPFTLPAGIAKDLRFNLPPGLVGDPTAIPSCSIGAFLHHVPNGNECPADTAIGVATIFLNIGNPQSPSLGGLGYTTQTVPVFNVEPQIGEPARFGFYLTLAGFGVLIDTSLRAGGDYGVTSTTGNISQLASFLSGDVTLWGVPGDPRHSALRGWGCLAATSHLFSSLPCTAPEAGHPAAFLDLPTSCAGAMQTTVEADSWSEEGDFHSFGSEPEPMLDGCNHLQFEPEIKVSPDGQQASKPTGLTVDVHVPQEGQLNGEGLAQSNVKDITVTLPAGVTLNPSAADGLQACSERLIGFEGFKEFSSEPGVSNPVFTPYLPGSTAALAAGDGELLQPSVNFCPDASKIAEAMIKTPLLPNPVKGFVYLASPQNFNVFPQENPFGTHVSMYIVAEDPLSGSLVKLPGKVLLNEATGQIESTFEETPQLPFEDAELHFFGGERAPLASPNHCGKYTTSATFTPWSGGEPVTSQSSFEITSGPNGSPCPGTVLPFNPTLASGTTNNNAGSYTPLDTTMSREDGQQPIQSVTLHYPAGVSGLLSGVKLCGEAEANAGTCGPESQIGETIVSVGVGGDPFTVTGGKAYITGPYDGAPFGLSIVNPAKAGPFDLQQGRPVVVRAKIEVDPRTAALTITTDPPGSPHAIPTIIEGFPLQIKHVNVLVNRPDFTFNPTNCTPTTVTGTIDSAEGASSPVSVPFQATNCASLQFTPKFAVATSGKNSKAYGTSLAVKLTYPSAPFGSQANIKQVKVELPRDLPSRLTTLQKACTAAQFDANPAGCPSASVIGHAKAITPLIPVPLEGPAYFVSNGGEAFPNLIVVLQGYGVTIDLVGDTFISKTGVTSSTFKTVPDAPVGSFELVLPEGKYSALTGLGNLCTEKLTMPTEFLAQNGASLHQSTPVGVTGCAKAKALTRAQKLAKALKLCKRDKQKAKRKSCERAARKKDGSKAKKKSKKKAKR
jgi:hypothetical protein